jgi:hypothetical protein
VKRIVIFGCSRENNLDSRNWTTTTRGISEEHGYKRILDERWGNVDSRQHVIELQRNFNEYTYMGF